MEKKNFVKTKTECICTEESDVSLNDGKSETNTVSTYEDEGSDINILEKNILVNPKKCICTKSDRAKTRYHVSWVDKEDDNSTECVCETVNKAGPPVFDNVPSITVIPPTPSTSAPPEEEQKKKKKSFVETLKNLVTCACLAKPRKSVELEPEPEIEGPVLETGDSGIISMLGRTYQPSTETVDTSEDWKKTPLVLVENKLKSIPVKAKPKPIITKTAPPRKELVKETPITSDDMMKTPQVRAEDKVKRIPAKPKPMIPKVPPRIEFVNYKEPILCQCDDETEYASKSSSRISVKASKVKCKCSEPDETPSGHLLPATKCVCGQESNASLASGYSSVSTASKPSYCYPAYSERSEELIRQIDYPRASQYSYGQYDEPLQTYGRELPYSMSAQSSGMSYGNSNQYMVEEDDDISQELVLRDVGSRYRNPASVVPSYISQASAGPPQLTLYRRLIKRFWLESLLYREPYPPPPLPRPIENIPSYSYSTTSVPNTVSLYRPALTYKTDSQARKPATKSKEKICRCSMKQLVPSKESKQKLMVEKPVKVEKPKTENLKPCKCTKKSSDTKKSKEDLKTPQTDVELDCHCLEILYMSKPSGKEEEKKSKSPAEPSGSSKDQDGSQSNKKYLNVPPIFVEPSKEKEAPAPSSQSKKTPQNIPTIIVEPPKEKAPTTDQTSPKSNKKSLNIPTVTVEPPKEVPAPSSKSKKKSQNIPTIVVESPKDKQAPATDENASNSSSTDSVVTVIDTHALTVPKFDTRKEARPGEDKKKEKQERQDAGGSSAENPQEIPPPLTEDASGWWDKSKHLIIGSTVVGATAIGAYQYFKE